MLRKISRNNKIGGVTNSVMPRTNMVRGNMSIKPIRGVRGVEVELTLPRMNSMRDCYSHDAPHATPPNITTIS